jgi:hypothetical protein
MMVLEPTFMVRGARPRRFNLKKVISEMRCAAQNSGIEKAASGTLAGSTFRCFLV